MYLSPHDIHESQTRALDSMHRLARSSLDRLDELRQLGVGLQRHLLAESRAGLLASADGASGNAIDASQAAGHRLLKEQIPQLLSGVTQAAVQTIGESIRAAENHLDTTGALLHVWWQRAQASSPWETAWMWHLASSATHESLATLEHIGETAASAAEKIETTVERQLPSAAAKRKRS